MAPTSRRRTKGRSPEQKSISVRIAKGRGKRDRRSKGKNLTAKVQSVCGIPTLGRVTRSRAWAEQEGCQNTATVDSSLLPRREGKCKVYWKTEHHGDAEWLGEPHLPGKWLEVETVEKYLGEQLVDLHACDIVQLQDYRGLGAYLVAVRKGRLVLIKTGGEYGYTLPPDAYAAAERFSYRKYYGSRHVLGYGGFIFNAELPEESTYFQKHSARRPGPNYHLYMSFLGENPETFQGIPSVEDDEQPLFWSKREWMETNW